MQEANKIWKENVRMFKRLRDIDFRKNNQLFPKLSKPELKLFPKRTSFYNNSFNHSRGSMKLNYRSNRKDKSYVGKRILHRMKNNDSVYSESNSKKNDESLRRSTLSLNSIMRKKECNRIDTDNKRMMNLISKAKPTIKFSLLQHHETMHKYYKRISKKYKKFRDLSDLKSRPTCK